MNHDLPIVAMLYLDVLKRIEVSLDKGDSNEFEQQNIDFIGIPRYLNHHYMAGIYWTGF